MIGLEGNIVNNKKQTFRGGGAEGWQEKLKKRKEKKRKKNQIKKP